MSKRCGGMVLGALMLGVTVLSAASTDARSQAASSISTELLDEWLGPAPATTMQRPIVWRGWVSSPLSMDIESQVAYQLALERFGVSDAPSRFIEGVAWHLQARIVEQLFDRVYQRPGHHVITLPLFGGHVHWSIPALTVSRSRRARDERVAQSRAHAAAVVATLEGVVGWPALAAALRQLAEARGSVDDAAAQARLEAALGVPLHWVFRALEPGFRLNYVLNGVDVKEADCGGQRCYRTTVRVSNSGSPLFAGVPHALAVPIALDFGGDAITEVMWSGDEAAHAVTVESAAAPRAVRLDPRHVFVVDDNWQDQQWQASPPTVAAPIKSLSAWMVWLQNAALTYGVLL